MKREMASTMMDRVSDDTLKHPRKNLPSIGSVLIVAALLRLGSIAIIHSFLHPQTWEFGPLARNIVAGLGFSDLFANGTYVPSVYMPPGYPYFLALFYRLGGESPATFLLIETVQAAIGVVLVYVVYRLALILIGKSGAVIAACLVAIYPTQVYMCNEFHPINLYIVLEVGAVFFLVRYLEVSKAWIDVVVAGICMGTLMFFRGETPALALVFAATVLFRGGFKATKPAVAFLLLAYAFITPWAIRNYSVFGRIVPVCASGGINLWIGNNPLATGDDRYVAADIVRGDFERGSVLPTEFEQLPADVKEAFSRIPIDRNSQIAKDEALKHLAVNFIRTHPKEEVTLTLKKLFDFLIFDPKHEKGRKPTYWVPSIVLSLLAIWGAVLRGKKAIARDLLLIASVLFAFAVGVVVFVLPRYKIVIDPFLIIFAANGLCSLLVAGERRVEFASIRNRSR